jgi:hypothetical protein
MVGMTAMWMVLPSAARKVDLLVVLRDMQWVAAKVVMMVPR